MHVTGGEEEEGCEVVGKPAKDVTDEEAPTKTEETGRSIEVETEDETITAVMVPDHETEVAPGGRCFLFGMAELLVRGVLVSVEGIVVVSWLLNSLTEALVLVVDFGLMLIYPPGGPQY